MGTLALRFIVMVVISLLLTFGLSVSLFILRRQGKAIRSRMEHLRSRSFGFANLLRGRQVDDEVG